mmetsp:Transcript_37077/g.94902  ORF Transcript_37077/g.94902 Transcript_37077/m.94902 type:complete len:102 (-) Transcript_37077:845-1150(-)
MRTRPAAERARRRTAPGSAVPNVRAEADGRMEPCSSYTGPGERQPKSDFTGPPSCPAWPSDASDTERRVFGKEKDGAEVNLVPSTWTGLMFLPKHFFHGQT